MDLNKMQKLFDKKIWSVSKHNGEYYVTLDDGNSSYNKNIYVVNSTYTSKTVTHIPLPILETYELIYSIGL